MICDLPLQPRTGTLTLFSVVCVDGRWYAVTLCYCSAFTSMPLGKWKDGSRRPERCNRCNIRHRRKGAAAYTPQRAPIVPFYKGGVHR